MAFSHHLEQLDITNERLAHMLGRLARVAEALDGSFPQDGSLARDTKPSAPSIHSMFADKIMAGQNYVDQLTSVLSRIEDSVIGETTRSGSTLMPTPAGKAGY